MDTLVKHRMTVAEFLAWAEVQPKGRRYELVSGEVIEMSPERLRHNYGKLDIAIAFRNAVSRAGLQNAVFTDGVGVVIEPDTTRVPDGIVTIRPIDEYDMDAQTVDDPLIIVEVVSPDSVKRDTIEKLAEYFSLSTVAHYLVVWQVERRVDHHARLPAGGTATMTLHPGEVLRLGPPGIEVAVTDLIGAAGG